jgi:hypothetical protein
MFVIGLEAPKCPELVSLAPPSSRPAPSSIFVRFHVWYRHRASQLPIVAFAASLRPLRRGLSSSLRYPSYDMPSKQYKQYHPSPWMLAVSLLPCASSPRIWAQNSPARRVKELHSVAQGGGPSRAYAHYTRHVNPP